jgi:hypothetical protein
VTAPTPQPGVRRLPIILALVGALGLLACTGLIIGIGIASDEDAPSNDIATITACQTRDGETRMEFTAHNSSTEATSYRLRFRVLDANGREISIGNEYVRTIQPGATRTDAITLEHPGKTGATCEYVGEAP